MNKLTSMLNKMQEKLTAETRKDLDSPSLASRIGMIAMTTFTSSVMFGIAGGIAGSVIGAVPGTVIGTCIGGIVGVAFGVIAGCALAYRPAQMHDH